MTDEQDPDSQPMHDEAAEHEHPVEAPVDDFSDNAATEEAATTQESSGEGEDGSSSMPEGRSRSMFPLMAGIVVILAVGGGVAYWQLGRSSSGEPSAIEQAMNTKTSMPKVDAAPPAAVEAPPAAATPAPATTETPAAAASATPPSAAPSDNVDALYKPTVDASGANPTPVQSAASATAVPPTAAEIPPPVPAQVNTAETETVAPATAAPAVAPVAAASTVEPVAVASAPVPVTASTAPAASTDAIDKLSSRIDDLQKSLDQAHQQLADMSSQTSAGQGSTMLEERLNKIEQDLAQLQHQKAAAKTATHKEPSAVTKVSAPAPAKAVSHKKTKKPVAHKTAAKAEKTTSKWVLRAATPSEAWVSSDATSSELKHIQVGDSLPGVGRVTAIRQSSKGWEIEGSEATLR